MTMVVCRRANGDLAGNGASAQITDPSGEQENEAVGIGGGSRERGRAVEEDPRRGRPEAQPAGRTGTAHSVAHSTGIVAPTGSSASSGTSVGSKLSSPAIAWLSGSGSS